jgi:hypothetical protein
MTPIGDNTTMSGPNQSPKRYGNPEMRNICRLHRMDVNTR